jgi:hypothetical protein
MAKLLNTLTETQKIFIRACEARGWRPDCSAVNPTVSCEIALAAVEDVLGYFGRRLENMEKIAERALMLQPMVPMLIPSRTLSSAPESATPAPPKPEPNRL